MNVRDVPRLVRPWEAQVPPELCATSGPAQEPGKGSPAESEGAAEGLLSRVRALASCRPVCAFPPQYEGTWKRSDLPLAIILTIEMGPRRNITLGRRRPTAQA